MTDPTRPWWEGPTNAIDRCIIEWNLRDWWAIADRLPNIPVWLIRERLASYKCPRRWEFRDSLPRTEAGKLYKRKIRDEYVAATEETRP